MKSTTFFLSLLILIISYACGPAEKADLVITNAKVITIDQDNPGAEAVAVKGDKIIAVGSSAAIKKYIDWENTEVIDASGRLLIPGFNDAHAHFGPINPDYVELRYITDPNTITQKVKEQVARSEPGELIRGGHWEHEMFMNREWPTKELLDVVAPDNPVVLSRADGHSVLVNSKVINNSGITKDTPDPFGGEIQRDPRTGEPTGIFKESATRLLKYGAVPVERTEEEKAEREWNGYLMALEKARKLGITSIQIPGRANWDMWDRLMEEGKLTSRIDIGGILTADEEELIKYKKQLEKYPYENDWLRFGYLKGFIDGTLGSGTALMFDPFSDEPDKAGLPQMTYEELEEKVVSSDAAGFQIGIHAIGTKANHWILNAYQKAAEENGTRDSRHRSEHAQLLIQEDIPRFADLEVIASMQPTHCITDKRFCEKRIGIERSKGAYAWSTLLGSGAKIAFGTDYSVEPLNPMEGLYAAVSRKDRLGEEGEGWFPEEKLTMEEAIRLYTLGSAYSQFMEDRKGMIKEGYLADMVITDKDLMSIDEDQIMKTKVDYTIVGGKVVFDREKRLKTKD
ncbi:MAG: amidohydrolase [Bacteroidales bacterium]|nr:amidohydrolase [Bacteroidales bacterium]